MENNLFSLGFQEQPGTFASDPAIHCALAQAKSLDGRADLFTRLSLYEQRLNRTLAQAKAELTQLQQERAKAQEQALKDAAQIRKLKQALAEPWQPEQNGFEFSSREMTVWMRRRQLIQEAQTFDFIGRLPLPESTSNGEIPKDISQKT